jgi:hypothetical protein
MAKELIIFVPGLSARAPKTYDDKLFTNLRN